MVERAGAGLDDVDALELAAQSPRSPWFMPYTFCEFSIERYVLPSSAGKSLSMSER